MRVRLCFFVVVALIGMHCPAAAQDANMPTDTAASLFSQMGTALSSPPIEPSPMTPERAELAHQLMVTLKYDTRLKAFSAVGIELQRQQFMAQIKALPPKQQTIVKASFNNALEAVGAQRAQIALDTATTYYGSRLSADELKENIAFYRSDIGVQIIDGKLLTPEQRQKSGLSILQQPALLKKVKLDFDLMKLQSADLPARQAEFTAAFQTRFCQNLAAAHMTSAICSATVRPKS
jgi:hypothetical protein